MAPRVDMHVHVEVLGDDPRYTDWGRISPWLRTQSAYRTMLLYAGIEPELVSDVALERALVRTVDRSGLDHAVCLALDPVFDTNGVRRPDRSNIWVANEYVTKVLRPQVPGKILPGASVHPYDPDFTTRVERCVEDGAVLLTWLPSAQQIDLADPRVLKALRFLATAGTDGGPLPLLLQAGSDHMAMSTDPRTVTYDFLSWSLWDRMRNALRKRGNRWLVPRVAEALANIRAGLKAGANVIFAHCGLPYLAPRYLGIVEHSDFEVIGRLVREHSAAPASGGRCYADVSGCLTPVRKGYFKAIARLPESRLLAGSGYPAPIFEVSLGGREDRRSFEAMVLRGDVGRIAVPQENLLDVNWRELKHAFGEHAMFRNAAELLLQGRD